MLQLVGILLLIFLVLYINRIVPADLDAADLERARRIMREYVAGESPVDDYMFIYTNRKSLERQIGSHILVWLLAYDYSAMHETTIHEHERISEKKDIELSISDELLFRYISQPDQLLDLPENVRQNIVKQCRRILAQRGYVYEQID